MFAYRQVHKNHLLNLYFIPLIFFSFLHACGCSLLVSVQFLINAAVCIQWLNFELNNQNVVTRLLMLEPVAFVIRGIMVIPLIWFEVVNSFL